MSGEIVFNANQTGTNNSNDLTIGSIIADNGGAHFPSQLSKRVRDRWCLTARTRSPATRTFCKVGCNKETLCLSGPERCMLCRAVTRF